MNISGDYGTELLLRYTEERLSRELEERRVINERAAEFRRENGTRLSRFARFFFREEVAAGGPEWVRPTVYPVPEAALVPVTEPVSVPAPTAAARVEADNTVEKGNPAEKALETDNAPEAENDERMPFRTLVGNRR